MVYLEMYCQIMVQVVKVIFAYLATNTIIYSTFKQILMCPLSASADARFTIITDNDSDSMILIFGKVWQPWMFFNVVEHEKTF